MWIGTIFACTYGAGDVHARGAARAGSAAATLRGGNNAGVLHLRPELLSAGCGGRAVGAVGGGCVPVPGAGPRVSLCRRAASAGAGLLCGRRAPGSFPAQRRPAAGGGGHCGPPGDCLALGQRRGAGRGTGASPARAAGFGMSRRRRAGRRAAADAAAGLVEGGLLCLGRAGRTAVRPLRLRPHADGGRGGAGARGVAVGGGDGGAVRVQRLSPAHSLSALQQCPEAAADAARPVRRIRPDLLPLSGSAGLRDAARWYDASVCQTYFFFFFFLWQWI